MKLYLPTSFFSPTASLSLSRDVVSFNQRDRYVTSTNILSRTNFQQRVFRSNFDIRVRTWEKMTRKRRASRKVVDDTKRRGEESTLQKFLNYRLYFFPTYLRISFETLESKSNFVSARFDTFYSEYHRVELIDVDNFIISNYFATSF